MTADYGPAAQVAAVRALHQRRVFPLDGLPGDYGICVEDRQAWPCATVEAIEAATCPICDGQGWTVEPVAQCGNYEHEHGDGCAVPEQVRCRCQREPTPPVDDEEPF